MTFTVDGAEDNTYVRASLSVKGDYLGALSISSENAEELEDLISVAMKQASDKASKEMESKMKAATGGLNIPGLNF